MLRFVSHVLWRSWWRARWRARATGILSRIVDIMISVTKQIEQQKQMFVAEVFRTTMKNFLVIHRQWRLLSPCARCLSCIYQSLRTGSLRSWNDLRISFRETGTAVHMIFRQNFMVPTSRPLVLSQESHDIVGQSCHCHSGTGWMLLLLLLAATRDTNLFSWFFKIKQHTSVLNFAQ